MVQGGGSVWGCWELCPVWKGLQECVVPSQLGINQPGLVLMQSRQKGGCCLLRSSSCQMLVQGPSTREILGGLDYGVEATNFSWLP